MNDKDQSKMLYVAKSLALVLIVWAHMSVGEECWEEKLRVAFSESGVTVFFVCSGFFYQRQKNDTVRFWRKKAQTLIAPWLLFATATFALSVFISRNLTGVLIRYIEWVLGLGSLYWFMSVLVICFIVFKFMPDKLGRRTAGLLLLIATSLVSVILSVFAVIPYGPVFNQFSNVFNWLGWFALGIMIREKKLLECITSPKLLLIGGPMWILFLILSTMEAGPLQGYIHICALPVEIFGTLTVLSIARLLRNVSICVDVGKKSFFVYLIHIQIAGVINALLPNKYMLFAIKPFIATAICYVLAKVCQWILVKAGLYQKCGKVLALR